jgi:hypothetical protein
MATFTKEELAKRQLIGIIATALCIAIALSCHMALAAKAGVPEFLETGRGIAWAGALVAATWTGLARAWAKRG